MRLVTFLPRKPRSADEAKDGHLGVVDKSGVMAGVVPDGAFGSLRLALQSWDTAEAELREIEAKLNRGKWPETVALQDQKILSPLPRAWAFMDGSAYLQHIILVRKARGAEPPEDMKVVPLMYQGLSDGFLAPTEDIPIIDEAYGLDLEGEVGVLLDDVPLGVTAQDAISHIKLLVLINDVTLRNLIPRELQAGFGFFQSKPASSFAPFAITPDECGDAWREGRLHLPLTCRLNGRVIGTPNAGEMHFSFGDLIAHAARTRNLASGSILGGGTVSNEPESAGVACLAETRMREKILTGQMTTPFLRVGDKVEIEMFQGKRNLFGTISQTVRES